MTVTWGVDMSTDARNIGVAKIDWSGDLGELIDHSEKPSRREDLDWLVDLLAGAHRRGEHAGIDVPFGWPIEFAAFLSKHARGPTPLPEPRVEATRTTREWSALASRLTDDVVRSELSRAGLSVSFDKLGATAAAWSYIEHRLAEQRVTFDRDGVGTTIFETWPSAAWQRFIDPKQNPATLEDELFIGALESVVRLDAAALAAARPRESHLKDAIVCAVVARCHQLNRTVGPEGANAQRERTRQEGWIHLPTSNLEELASRLTS